MGKSLGIGIGATTLAALAFGISVASAAPPDRSGWSTVPPATSAASTVTGLNVVEARSLAQAAVPGGHVVQIESDDGANRQVWKVTVDAPAERVIVLVDEASAVVSLAN